MEVKPTYGYTADVRVLPDGWKLKRLEEVVTTLPSGIYGNEKTSDGLTAMPVATTAHISEDDSWNGKEMQQRFFTPTQIASYSVKKGDLVVVKSSGSAASIKSGKIGLVEDEQAGTFVFSNFLMTLRPIGVQSRYLYFYLTSHNVKKLLPSLVEASTYPNLRKNEYLAIEVPIPEEQEQAAIAEALSDADALIESLEQLLAKKRHVKQGAMQELLTGKKRLPGFNEEWEVKRLGNTAILKARIGWQGLTTAEYLESGDYYLVTGTEFKDGYIDWNACHYVNESRYEQDKYIQLKAHDVLVTKDGTIGKVALVTNLPKPATLNSGVFVIRPVDNAFHPEFFYYLLCSNVFSEFLVQLSAGSTINHLYQKDFVNFVYKTPATTGEQTAIAAVLSDMDAEIAAREAKLAKARRIKQGMMQELLTGRIRLV